MIRDLPPTLAQIKILCRSTTRTDFNLISILFWNSKDADVFPLAPMQMQSKENLVPCIAHTVLSLISALEAVGIPTSWHPSQAVPSS